MSTNLVGNRIQLRRSTNTYGELTAGKNKNSIRAFTMFTSAQNIMNNQLARHIFGIILKPIYHKRWKTYCQAKGIPYISATLLPRWLRVSLKNGYRLESGLFWNLWTRILRYP